MGYIVEPIILQRAIQLGNEEFGRTMSIGTNWTKIRIGIRCAVNGVGGLINAGLALGVCQGTTNMYKSVTCTDFVGIHFGITPDNSTFTFVLTSPAYYTQGSVSLPTITKVNGTLTNRSGQNTTSYLGSAPGTTAVVGYVDILKGSSYTVTPYWPNSVGNVQTNSTALQFITGMETDGTPSNVAAYTAATYAYTGAGLFDTVNVSWSRSTPTLTIFNLAVCRFS